MKSIRNKLAIGSAALIIGASSGCTVFEDIVNDPLPRFLQSGSYRDRKEEERERLNQQKQMIIPKYESGDTYIAPDGNQWVKLTTGLWGLITKTGATIIYPKITDFHITSFSEKSGLPIIRKKQDK